MNPIACNALQLQGEWCCSSTWKYAPNTDPGQYCGLQGYLLLFYIVFLVLPALTYYFTALNEQHCTKVMLCLFLHLISEPCECIGNNLRSNKFCTVLLLQFNFLCISFSLLNIVSSVETRSSVTTGWFNTPVNMHAFSHPTDITTPLWTFHVVFYNCISAPWATGNHNVSVVHIKDVCADCIHCLLWCCLLQSAKESLIAHKYFRAIVHSCSVISRHRVTDSLENRNEQENVYLCNQSTFLLPSLLTVLLNRAFRAKHWHSHKQMINIST